MAATLMLGKSWNPTNTFTIKLYSSCTSSSLCNQYAFFPFHSTAPKRHRFGASSSSSSSSYSSSTRAPHAKQGLRRSVKLDCPCSSSKPSAMSGEPMGLSFKSLFGKRSLWRRIFFASKKVRSIILLNGKNIGKEGKVYNQGEGNREKLEDLSLRVCLVGRRENRKGGVVHHLTREMRNEADVLSLMLFASSIPVVKEVEAIVDPASFTVVRFALAAIPFVPFVLRAQDDVDTRNAGIELGFWVSLGYLLQALGLLTSDAGRATFLSMLTVIVVPLLDGMLGAVVPTRTWFGALMSVLGVAMLECSGSPPCVGDLLNFLSALFFGVHMLRTEHIARNTKKEKFLPLLGYEVCVVAVFSTIWYLVGGFSGGFQEYNPSMWTWAKFWDWMVSFPWVPAVYTGIFSSGLCLWGESTSLSFYKITIIVVVTILNVSSNSSFTISVNENAQTEQMAAMRDVSATETAIIYALEPVWGGGFAWFLLGERWGTAGWVGAALVLGGSLTVQICGSSPEDSYEDDTGGAKLENGRVSSNEKGFPASPVIISSKDISDLLK
ncbi:hypothetical protein TIFTF001_038883 [Ficus carica]|uniref:EamA domain-containing protein n=1 Tax=Ficus carica TaxID=3494 RepID=A0AA88E9R7_FICCA|nr:hypothetical protein TIFTF001_038883 [Ficus carica]